MQKVILNNVVDADRWEVMGGILATFLGLPVRGGGLLPESCPDVFCIRLCSESVFVQKQTVESLEDSKGGSVFYRVASKPERTLRVRVMPSTVVLCVSLSAFGIRHTLVVEGSSSLRG